MFRNILRAVAILAAVVLTAWATNWVAWHPSEVEGLKTGFGVELTNNIGVAMMATAGMVLALVGALERRWAMAAIGVIIFIVSAFSGFFILRGPAQDTSLTVKMVLVPIALLVLIAFAMPDFRQTSDGPQGSTNSAPKSGRVARTANRLNDWGNSLERRFRYWRQDRQYDRETRRAERAAAVPPPPPYADTDDDPFAGMPDRMPRPSLAYPATSTVVDHSTTPAAPASGTTTSA